MFRPKTFKEFRGNMMAIKTITSILNENTPSLTIVVGGVASGKTSLASILKHEYDSELLYVGDHLVSEEIQKAISNFINHRTIIDMLNRKKRKIVFIDDIDIVLTNFKTLPSLLNTMRLECLCIVTVSSLEERKISSVKKIPHNVVRFRHLDVSTTFDLFRTHLQTLNECCDDEQLLQIVKDQGGNLHNIKLHVTSLIKSGHSSSFRSIHHCNTDTIYEQTEKVFNQSFEGIKLMEDGAKDCAMVCLLVHENLTALNSSKMDKLAMKAMVYLYSSLCDYDEIERNCYLKCDWGNIAQDISVAAKLRACNHAIMKCGGVQLPTTAFTQHFTKLSAQMSMRKRINDLGGGKNTSSMKLFCLHQMTNPHPVVKRFAKDFGLA